MVCCVALSVSCHTTGESVAEGTWVLTEYSVPFLQLKRIVPDVVERMRNVLKLVFALHSVLEVTAQAEPSQVSPRNPVSDWLVS